MFLVPAALAGMPPDDPCLQYRSIAAVHDACLAQMVDGFPGTAKVIEFCSQAYKDPWMCRQAWAVAHARGDRRAPFDDLMLVCGGNSDCGMEVVDAQPEKDVLIQLQRCHTYALNYELDCAGHAMQHWWERTPGPIEVARVGTYAGPPEPMGHWIAARVACDHVGACPTEGPVAQVCASESAIFLEQPHQCDILHVSVPGQPR